MYVKLTAQQFANAEKLINPLLREFGGNTPVKICVVNKDGSKKVYLADRNNWVDLAKPIEKELRLLLGNDNVKIIEG